MPSIQYSGLLNGATVKAVHIGHHETLYLTLLLPAIEGLKEEENDDLLREMDEAASVWAVEELMTVGFVSLLHLWERQFREFLIEQSVRPEISVPKQNKAEAFVAYVRRVMNYFEAPVAQHIWVALERAASVVNAFKHGIGPRFDKVMERHPTYFYAPEDQRHPPMVFVSKAQFEALISAAYEFWSDLPVVMVYDKHDI